MKRFLLGMVGLTGLAGVGSAGVFYAQGTYTAWAAPQGEAATAPAELPRDLTPQPIPLGSYVAGEGTPAADGDDRYAKTERVVQVNQDASSDIPDAGNAASDEMPATRSANPFASRETPRRPARAAARYPERPAAAEMPEQEAVAEQPAEIEPNPAESEPRMLNAPALGGVDRYGRAVEAQPDNRVAEQPEPEARQPRRIEEPAAAPRAVEEPAPVEEQPREPAVAEEPATSEGTGRPGDPQLNGSQAPTLTIEKTAPPEIQIGKPAKFTIKVRNAGTVVAHGVEIHDLVPQGTQLIDTTPPAKRGEQGALVWELGTLKPGEEQKAELQLMPTAEGEVGSVATVHFHAAASVRTMSTRPMLTVEMSAPPEVMKGSEVTFKIKLSNPGSGAATGILLSEQVPEGLSHPSGTQLELEVGTLKPGESRELELGLIAAKAGPVANLVTAQGDGNLKAEARSDLEVVSPALQVSLTGPKRRYLERNATHTITVANPGTAAAKEIELVAVLPKELKFIEANNGGQFDAASHSVYWSLEELPPQETGSVTLTTLPLQTGDARLQIKSQAQGGLKDQREEIVAIEGIAAINFQVSDINGPVEVNGQTTYEVRVTNQGSKAATNLRIAALMPRELKPLSADGPVRYRVEGQRVVFEPLKQLAPKADTTFTIKAQAQAAGDLRVQVQLTTDDIREPITKEESTRVFSNE